MAEKNLKYALLYDIYGELLSDKQGYALEMYYCDDLSLAEIAEHTGITRQGVRDQIKHAEEELDRYEAALGLFEKNTALTDIIERMQKVCNENGEIKKLCAEAMQLLET